jgi:glycosyltransferase involved in cell wall biosynthesis
VHPLVLLPAFNEAESIGSVLFAVSALGYPACVIDDGSRDNTADIARRAGADVLRLPVNLGVGGALRCGFRHAIERGYDCVVQVDADGQHDPAQVPALLAALEDHEADMAVGSRFLGGDPWAVGRGRRLAMRALAARASHSLGIPITDATSGFRAIRGRLLEAFAESYPVEYLGDTLEALIMAGRMGAKVVEVRVSMRQRVSGRPSAGSLSSIWYVVRVLAAIELMRPMRRPPPTLPSDHGVAG